ncbi:hypothetical protein LMG27952_05015 [Paraburkholderia hiiakae]|uniref:DUF4148 domain-containing protein n=1 Tax=Paraburkholderia hiiakae TaxID=1081782 RepID=A0ABM8NZB5_9BURK|nr:hypothetical protein [Paraburkholderia hiiakae]CAD6550465.1 hypothetical protein LMG27952_05015 [Paraburkholderia hiiakae]
MKRVARLVILAGVLTAPNLASAQSPSAVDGQQVQAQYAQSLQASNKSMSPDEVRSGLDGRVREKAAISTSDSGAGINGYKGERYPAEVRYSSYSPPIYVAR